MAKAVKKKVPKKKRTKRPPSKCKAKMWLKLPNQNKGFGWSYGLARNSYGQLEVVEYFPSYGAWGTVGHSGDDGEDRPHYVYSIRKEDRKLILQDLYYAAGMELGLEVDTDGLNKKRKEK